jgi:parvulin-like peptidyl-prolyl isomerase
MRRLPLLLVALVAVLLPASCATGGGGIGAADAAVVNGVAISQQDLLDDLDALASNATVRSNLQAQGVAVYGPTEGSYSSAFSTQVLSSLVIDALIADELAQRGVEPTSEDRAQAEQQIGTSAGSFPQAFIDRQVTSLANRLALERELAAEPLGEVTDDEVRAYYDQNIDAIVERNGEFVCLSHILVDTREQAEAALARIRAGEDFAAVAREVSKDTGSASAGGDLGCQPRGQFVAAFEDAAFAATPGEVTGPVETEFGVHLLLVRAKGVPPFEEIANAIRQYLEQQRASGANPAFDAWLSDAVRRAEVTIDPKWGRWDPEQYPQVVVPPEGAASPTTSVPALLGSPDTAP